MTRKEKENLLREAVDNLIKLDIHSMTSRDNAEFLMWVDDLMDDKFTIDELEKWLNEIAYHNDNDLGQACLEIVSRLDGFKNFVADMRGEEE